MMELLNGFIEWGMFGEFGVLGTCKLLQCIARCYNDRFIRIGIIL